MTSDRTPDLLRLIDAINRPYNTYRRSVRRAQQVDTDSPESDAVIALGEAALVELETAVRRWVAGHPYAGPRATAIILREALAKLRAIPIQCTALTGPTWYGEGWKDALTELEELAVHAADSTRPDPVAVLAYARHVSEYRIPCPGHRLGAHGDLMVRRLPDADQWAIYNPNLEPGPQVWTGKEYQRIGDIHHRDAYQWDRETALALAPGLAEHETARDTAWFESMRYQGTAP